MPPKKVGVLAFVFFVTGAFIVIGLKCGGTRYDQEASQEKEKLVREFLTEFKSRYCKDNYEGLPRCKELLGYDLNIPEERKIIEENNIAETKCPELINTSITILHKLLNSA